LLVGRRYGFGGGGGGVWGLGSGGVGVIIIYAKCNFVCWHSFLHIKFLLGVSYNYMQLLDVIEANSLLSVRSLRI